VCACVCVRERESERERVCVCAYQAFWSRAPMLLPSLRSVCLIFACIVGGESLLGMTPPCSVEMYESNVCDACMIYGT